MWVFIRTNPNTTLCWRTSPPERVIRSVRSGPELSVYRRYNGADSKAFLLDCRFQWETDIP